MKRLVILLPILILTSCFGLFDSGSDNIVGNYEVGWIDFHETRAIYNQEEVIPAYVFAVGHNSKFIVAKQHPLISWEEAKVDYNTINYFIIDIGKQENNHNGKGVYGPLPKSKFDSLRQEFRIQDIEFDIIYPEHL